MTCSFSIPVFAAAFEIIMKYLGKIISEDKNILEKGVHQKYADHIKALVTGNKQVSFHWWNLAEVPWKNQCQQILNTPFMNNENYVNNNICYHTKSEHQSSKKKKVKETTEKKKWQLR